MDWGLSTVIHYPRKPAKSLLQVIVEMRDTLRLGKMFYQVKVCIYLGKCGGETTGECIGRVRATTIRKVRRYQSGLINQQIMKYTPYWNNFLHWIVM